MHRLVLILLIINKFIKKSIVSFKKFIFSIWVQQMQAMKPSNAHPNARPPQSAPHQPQSMPQQQQQAPQQQQGPPMHYRRY